jgi:hypothetical protein
MSDYDNDIDRGEELDEAVGAHTAFPRLLAASSRVGFFVSR